MCVFVCLLRGRGPVDCITVRNCRVGKGGRRYWQVSGVRILRHPSAPCPHTLQYILGPIRWRRPSCLPPPRERQVVRVARSPRAVYLHRHVFLVTWPDLGATHSFYVVLVWSGLVLVLVLVLIWFWSGLRRRRIFSLSVLRALSLLYPRWTGPSLPIWNSLVCVRGLWPVVCGLGSGLVWSGLMRGDWDLGYTGLDLPGCRNGGMHGAQLMFVVVVGVVEYTAFAILTLFWDERTTRCLPPRKHQPN